jgi:cbb3-type cytochrome oxidase maturation protein
VTYVLLPLAIVLSSLGLGCFVWAVRDGQLDDLEGPRWRILYDDEPRKERQGACGAESEQRSATPAPRPSVGEVP